MKSTRTSLKTTPGDEDRYAFSVDFETWATVIAGASLVVAAIALVDSARAVRHAKDANGIAQQALALQTRVEARHGEFRDVRWDTTLERATGRGMPAFTLRNIGTTDACNVTVVVTIDGIDQKRYLSERIRPGEAIRVASGAFSAVAGLLATVDLVRESMRVHWTSEAGEPGDWQSVPLQIF